MTTAPSKTILIVDDSRVSRMMIRALVAQHRPAWRIVEAANGDEALALVTRETPDFVTLDINMPGIMGTEVAEHMRRDFPALPMVLFSANVQGSHQARAAAIGAGFVAKPVNEKSVLQAIALLESRV